MAKKVAKKVTKKRVKKNVERGQAHIAAWDSEVQGNLLRTQRRWQLRQQPEQHWYTVLNP